MTNDDLMLQVYLGLSDINKWDDCNDLTFWQGRRNLLFLWGDDIMKILFRRSQKRERPWFWLFIWECVRFDLWCKIDVSDEERKMIEFYNLDFAIIDRRFNMLLLKIAAVIAVIVAVVLFFPIAYYTSRNTGAFLAVAIGVFIGWYFYDWYRQEIWVRDLLAGRTFRTFSVWDLVVQEEYLRKMAAALEQTMHAAKTWGADDIADIPKVDEDFVRTVIAERYR